MLVKFVDQSHKKFGQQEHVSISVGKTLIALGTAEEIKPPRYGAPGWREWRMAQSAQATGSHAEDTAVPFVEGTKWDLVEYPDRVVIKKMFGFTTEFYDQLPNDAPESLVRQLAEVNQARALRGEANAKERARAEGR